VVVLSFWFYGFFLSKSKPTMAIAIIIAMTATAIPIVKPDIVANPETGVDVGAAVAEGPCTTMLVSELEPQ